MVLNAGKCAMGWFLGPSQMVECNRQKLCGNRRFTESWAPAILCRQEISWMWLSCDSHMQHEWLHLTLRGYWKELDLNKGILEVKKIWKGISSSVESSADCLSRLRCWAVHGTSFQWCLARAAEAGCSPHRGLCTGNSGRKGCDYKYKANEMQQAPRLPGRWNQAKAPATIKSIHCSCFR